MDMASKLFTFTFTFTQAREGPVSCVQLSERGFRVVYPLGLRSQLQLSVRRTSHG